MTHKVAEFILFFNHYSHILKDYSHGKVKNAHILSNGKLKFVYFNGNQGINYLCCLRTFAPQKSL